MHDIIVPIEYTYKDEQGGCDGEEANSLSETSHTFSSSPPPERRQQMKSRRIRFNSKFAKTSLAAGLRSDLLGYLKRSPIAPIHLRFGRFATKD
jgi:hypothetical protein